MATATQPNGYGRGTLQCFLRPGQNAVVTTNQASTFPSGANERTSTMASSPTLSLVKTLFVPAVVSLILFLFLTFVLVPVWRRYRNRYSQYIPVESITSHTAGLRHRFVHQVSRLALPSTWSRNRGQVDVAPADFDLEAGEELHDVDENALRAHLSSFNGEETQRLSRDLEEGFMDDSDEEDQHR